MHIRYIIFTSNQTIASSRSLLSIYEAESDSKAISVTAKKLTFRYEPSRLYYRIYKFGYRFEHSLPAGCIISQLLKCQICGSVFECGKRNSFELKIFDGEE